MNQVKQLMAEEMVASYLSVLMEKTVKDKSREWARGLIQKTRDEGSLKGKKIKLSIEMELRGGASEFIDSVVFETASLSELQEAVNAVRSK